MNHRLFANPQPPTSTDRNRSVPRRGAASTTSAAATRSIVVALAVLFAAAAVITVGAPSAHAKGAPPDCDSKHSTKFRWAQKTAQDERAASIPQAVQTTTIVDLSKQPAPNLTTSTKRQPLESHQVAINPALISFKLEKDGDIHLVVEDSAHHPMVVEFPDPACAPKTKFPKSIGQARNKLLQACGMPPADHHRVLPPVTARIQGIPFFDQPHKVRDHAPNFIELHPVTGFAITAAPPVTGSR